MSVSTKQARIAKLAREDRQRALTTLNHYLDMEWMLEAYRRTRKDAAPGVDGVTARDYAKELGANLQSLLNRAKDGSFRAPPVRRKYIPKGKGEETRPIGIPTFESKVLERSVVMLLQPIYEQDFLDCSYAFRPQRGPHDALDAMWRQLMDMEGCWLIDADVRKYYDTVDFKHLRAFLDKRVRDGVIRRLIDKWLKAGVWEAGQVRYPSCGTPQGGVISPLLSNVYLHEVLDRWFEEVVKPRLKGRAFLVRFADDFVIGCELRRDAERIMAVLAKRFAKYGLTIHPEKTRLVDFRKPDRTGRREKPETFDFVGFTHYWGRSQNGTRVVKQRTAKDRMQRTIGAVGDWCREHRHWPIPAQAEALAAKLRGHFTYYGVSGNSPQLARVRYCTARVWRKWLNRRTRGDPMNWDAFQRRILANHPLPPARILWTARRFAQRRDARRLLPDFMVAFT